MNSKHISIEKYLENIRVQSALDMARAEHDIRVIDHILGKNILGKLVDSPVDEKVLDYYKQYLIKRIETEHNEKIPRKYGRTMKGKLKERRDKVIKERDDFIKEVKEYLNKDINYEKIFGE